MKCLYKTIAAAAISLPLSLPLILGGCGCGEDVHIQLTNLEGTVFSEAYTQATGGGCEGPEESSVYIFSIDTDLGRKAIAVHDYYIHHKLIVAKESLDALIEKGTHVEVENIPRTDLGRQFITVHAAQVKVK